VADCCENDKEHSSTIKAGNLLTSWGIIGSSRILMLRGTSYEWHILRKLCSRVH